MAGQTALGAVDAGLAIRAAWQALLFEHETCVGGLDVK